MDVFLILQNSPVLFACLMLILGLCLGSFLNVVIYRLPRMMQQSWRSQCYVVLNLKEDYDTPRLNLFTPRSHCPNCKKMITLWHNIPLISFFLQKGRCSHCKQPISIQYPLVEFLTGIITFILALKFGMTFLFLAAAIFSWCLIPLIFIDLKYQILPDEINLFLLWAGLFFNLFSFFATPQSAILGAIIGYLVFWLIAQGFKYLRKKDGMGYGDFKLNAALGAWFGVKSLLVIILLSSFLGLLVGLFLLLTKRLNREQPLAYGPYLATAGFIYLYFGNAMYLWLLQLVR